MFYPSSQATYWSFANQIKTTTQQSSKNQTGVQLFMYMYNHYWNINAWKVQEKY